MTLHPYTQIAKQILQLLIWVVTAGFVLLVATTLSNGFTEDFLAKLIPWAGRLAVIAFALSLLPGIAKRLGIHSEFIKNAAPLAKEFGILMFLLALFHYLGIRLLPSLLFGNVLELNLPLYEWFGLISLLLAFPLFITSNNYSRERLGIWWKRVHMLAYIIVWTIFLHIALEDLSIWAIIIGIVAVLEVLSLVVEKMRPQPAPVTPAM